MQLAVTVITYISLLELSQKNSPSRVMQIIKSITAREIFKEYPGIRKQLWGGELWSDGGYIGTVGDGTTSDIIKNYVQNQGNEEEKQSYKQMKIIDFK
jgi:putative transposase